MNGKRIVLAAPQPRFDSLELVLTERHGVEVVRVRTRDELTLDRLAAANPRYVIFPHWSWKIPSTIYEKYECVIFHMTDLPFGRGGSPLQNLIVRGFKDTQLTALRCVEELDAGPIYLQRPLSLEGSAEEIFARAALMMEEMIDLLLSQEPLLRPQTGPVVCFERRTPEQSDLSSAASLQEIYDKIRMLDADGYPRAFIDAENVCLEFSQARINENCVQATVRIRMKHQVTSK